MSQGTDSMGDDSASPLHAMLESSRMVAQLAEEVARHEEELFSLANAPARAEQETAIVVAIVVCLLVLALSLGALACAVFHGDTAASSGQEAAAPTTAFDAHGHAAQPLVRARAALTRAAVARATRAPCAAARRSRPALSLIHI